MVSRAMRSLRPLLDVSQGSHVVQAGRQLT